MRHQIWRKLQPKVFSIGQDRVHVSYLGLNVIKRDLHVAPRQRRTDFWTPQATLSQSQDATVDAGQLLVRAGYLRQAYSGIFHMLPLGLRVQAKIEALVDKHMQSLQASKVSLSSISSQKLWSQSGRLDKGSEFFKFNDRKGARWLLAPTHEEEITTLVKEVIHAPGHLPIRLYQISRKYRDEKRPRGGLLRGREFIMKDLYTFDATETDAHITYDQVREAYNSLFSELKVPYIEARADSGNMGGTLSHEFHFPSNIGEDDIITCSTCDLAKNEEFVPPFETNIMQLSTEETAGSAIVEGEPMRCELFISKDRNTLVKAFVVEGGSYQYPSINPFVVKKCLGGRTDIDTGVEDAGALFAQKLEARDSNIVMPSVKGLLTEKFGSSETGSEDFEALFTPKADNEVSAKVYYLFDQSITQQKVQFEKEKDLAWLQENKLEAFVAAINDPDAKHSHLLKKRNGDPCPVCVSNHQHGTLTVQKAIEVGHTFHLGERYSSKLGLRVPSAKNKGTGIGDSFVSMGCHGIGVSRLIAAVASASSDKKGLIWPRAVAPFEVLIIVNTKNEDFAETIETGNQIYDNLSNHATNPADVLIDNRPDFDFGWKLKDADLIGYPVVVVLGKGWLKGRLVEIQCRRLDIKEQVPLEVASNRIRDLLERL